MMEKPSPAMHRALRQAQFHRYLVVRNDRLYHPGGNQPVCSLQTGLEMVRSGWLMVRDGTRSHPMDCMHWTCSEFGEERPMFHSLTMLAIDANRVVGLRVMKLMLGGRGARREAQLMVSEKIDEAFKASASLMAGASGDEIVRRYRRRVAANAKRLGTLNSNRPVLRARRRRK